ncbi:hypothetical protein [Halomonas sp. BC04]|uniref:hypothetical protein n=1 Tax=Halomonas sp. BC04 TaxID=1403540 RepID=UPI0012DEE755|nr:hypothetical protein [Halomonas sp. BC04]
MPLISLPGKPLLEYQHQEADNDDQANEKDDAGSAGQELQHDYLRVLTFSIWLYCGWQCV